MPLSTARANLLIAAVILVAVISYGSYVRAKWNGMQAHGGVKSLITGLGAEKQSDGGPANFRSRIPDWVPLYPGAITEGLRSSQAGIEHYLDVQLHTGDQCTKVIDWYENTLKHLGYNVYQRFEYGDPGCTSTIQSDGPGFHRSIYVSASGGVEDISIAVRAVEREVSGGATPEIPKWVPLYPGAALPKHLDATNKNGEYHLNFSFESSDDPKKVYDWYQAQLAKLGLRTKYEVSPHAAGRFFSQTEDNKRSFTIHNSPGMPDNAFIVDVIDHSQF